MPKISHQCLCDYNGESLDRFFRLQAKGGAVACALAYPTKESFGASGCEKAVTVATETFMRRPSMSDKAPPAISGFINDALYRIQDPHKLMFCSTAVLYIVNGQFRCILSGAAKLLHFNGGELKNTFDGGDNPLFGKHLNADFTSSQVIELPHGTNAFLLHCGCEDADADSAALGQAMQSVEDAGQWLSNAPELKALPGAKLAVVIPERKSLFKNLFGAK